MRWMMGGGIIILMYIAVEYEISHLGLCNNIAIKHVFSDISARPLSGSDLNTTLTHHIPAMRVPLDPASVLKCIVSSGSAVAVIAYLVYLTELSLTCIRWGLERVSSTGVILTCELRYVTSASGFACKSELEATVGGEQQTRDGTWNRTWKIEWK